MKDQLADQNKHLYEAYTKIVELQEKNAKLKEDNIKLIQRLELALQAKVEV